MKGNGRRAGRSLLLVVLIGVGLAIGWLGLVAGWAGETPAAKVPEPEASPSSQTLVLGERAGADGQSDKAQGTALDDVRDILQVLNQRKDALAKKEESLRDTEARIALLKAEAEKILDRYEKAVKAAGEKQEAEGKKSVRLQMEARKASVAQAVKMFESMPPEDAATRLEKMPEHTAMELLRELKPKTAGAILAVVKPEKAAKLTEKFFGPVAREPSLTN